MMRFAVFSVLYCALLSVQGNDQKTSTPAEIAATCFAFLEEHLCAGEKWGKPFHFYKPSSEKYSADQVNKRCYALFIILLMF